MKRLCSCQQRNSSLCTDDTLAQWCVSVLVSNVTPLLPVHRRHCGSVERLCSCQQRNSAQTSITGDCTRVFKYNLLVPCMDYCQFVSPFSRGCQYFQLTKLNKGITFSVTDCDASVCALQFEIVYCPMMSAVSTVVFQMNPTLKCVHSACFIISLHYCYGLMFSKVKGLTIKFRYHREAGFFALLSYLLKRQFLIQYALCFLLFFSPFKVLKQLFDFHDD